MTGACTAMLMVETMAIVVLVCNMNMWEGQARPVTNDHWWGTVMGFDDQWRGAVVQFERMDGEWQLAILQFESMDEWRRQATVLRYGVGSRVRPGQ
ncbi:hypothetical protein Scep_019250 [Stephania cephalantha]|uniref:Uncharacterized protein n=1 Tax=Stephania cephalantha TaxID=152367 RepID=A0AAP0NPN6_9MAGN